VPGQIRGAKHQKGMEQKVEQEEHKTTLSKLTNQTH
jgi:hypothetical protein